jgi:hypothetical protein
MSYFGLPTNLNELEVVKAIEAVEAVEVEKEVESVEKEVKVETLPVISYSLYYNYINRKKQMTSVGDFDKMVELMRMVEKDSLTEEEWSRLELQEILQTLQLLPGEYMTLNVGKQGDIDHPNIQKYIGDFTRAIGEILDFIKAAHEVSGSGMGMVKDSMTSKTFILRVSHLLYLPIIKLVYLLASMFNKVGIIKPQIGNVIVHDKYIICKGFKLSFANMQHLSHLIGAPSHTHKDGLFGLLGLLHMPSLYFLNKINDINIIHGHKQLDAMVTVVHIYKNKYKSTKIDELKKQNNQKFIAWCKKYSGVRGLGSGAGLGAGLDC